MLPPEPQSLEQLRARLPEALVDVYDVSQAMPVRPGEQRKHIFDFEDGTRIIISRERFQPSEPSVTHISASFHPSAIVAGSSRAGFVKHIRDRCRDLGLGPIALIRWFSLAAKAGLIQLEVKSQNE